MWVMTIFTFPPLTYKLIIKFSRVKILSYLSNLVTILT